MLLNKISIHIFIINYPKTFITMFRIDNILSPNAKLIIKTEVKLTLDDVKEYIYDNTINLMLQWWDRNLFYKNYLISKDVLNITRTVF